MTEKEILELHSKYLDEMNLDQFFEDIQVKDFKIFISKNYAMIFYQLGLRSVVLMNKKKMLRPEFDMRDLGMTFENKKENKVEYLAMILKYINIIDLSSIQNDILKNIYYLLDNKVEMKKIIENTIVINAIETTNEYQKPIQKL